MSNDTKPELVSCTFDSKEIPKPTEEPEARVVACTIHKELEPQVVACTFDQSSGQGGDSEKKGEECKDKKDTPPPCPKCGTSSNVVKIVFGMPTPALAKEAEDGKVALGGCCPPMPGEKSRNYKCKTCKADF